MYSDAEVKAIIDEAVDDAHKSDDISLADCASFNGVSYMKRKLYEKFDFEDEYL